MLRSSFIGKRQVNPDIEHKDSFGDYHNHDSMVDVRSIKKRSGNTVKKRKGDSNNF